MAQHLQGVAALPIAVTVADGALGFLQCLQTIEQSLMSCASLGLHRAADPNDCRYRKFELPVGVEIPTSPSQQDLLVVLLHTAAPSPRSAHFVRISCLYRYPDQSKHPRTNLDADLCPAS